MKSRILIVDDHFVIREGVKAILAGDGFDVLFWEAASGQEAVEMVAGGEWDLVLLDVEMPEMSGLEALRRIRHIAPNLPVLMLSMHEEAPWGIRALSMGAAGYVRKNMFEDSLSAAVKATLAGRRYLGQVLSQKLVEQVLGGHSIHALTERQRQIMLLMAGGHPVGAIATQLSLSINTVNTYRRRIFTKLGVKNQAQLTRYAISSGLLDGQDPE